MKEEEHRTALEEHLKAIERCIKEGLAENQRNIAYNVSQASIELFSLYLHKMNLTTASDSWDHRMFKKVDAAKRTPDFPDKTKIMALMKIIEEKRIILGYGKRRAEKEIEDMIMAFNKLRENIGD